jgi:hypothetical protein
MGLTRVRCTGYGIGLAALIQRGAELGGLWEKRDGEGKRWAGCTRIGPICKVLKIAFQIFKLIFYFPNCCEFKQCLKFNQF